MPVPLYQIDAFAGEAFGGNPAAVVLLDREADAEWMQRVAAEMNLSETAFTWAGEDGRRHLRWFTPTVEVQLCGHATLATAAALHDAGLVDPASTIRFQTRFSGMLAARAVDPPGADWLEIDLPARPATELSAAQVQQTGFDSLAMLGREAERVAGSVEDLLVQVAVPTRAADADPAAALRELEPDFVAIAGLGFRGVIVTCAGTPASGAGGPHFVSRYFAPAIGIREDPATGAAHCVLGPWWADRLGRSELTAYQASRRGGTFRVRVQGDRVHLAGQTRIVFRGDLLV